VAVAFRDENINKEKREKIHGSEHHAARLAITPREKPRSDQPRALYVDEHGTLYWFADASGNFNEAFVFTQDTYAADMPYAIGVIVDYDLDHRWTIPYGNINEPCPDSFFPTIWNCPDADEWKDISNASRMNTRGHIQRFTHEYAGTGKCDAATNNAQHFSLDTNHHGAQAWPE